MVKKRKRHVDEDEEEDEEEEDEDEDEEEDKKRGKAKTIKPRASSTDKDSFTKEARKAAGKGGRRLPILRMKTGKVYRGVLTGLDQTEYQTSGEYHHRGDPLVRASFDSAVTGMEEKYPPGVWLIGGAHERKGEMVLSPTQNTALNFAKEHKDEFPLLVDFGQVWVKPRKGGRDYKVAHFKIIKHLKARKHAEAEEEEDEDEEED